MKIFAHLVALTLAAATGTTAHAKDATSPAPQAAPVAAAALAPGVMLKTADGSRIGRVDRVMKGADGQAERVSVIYNSRFVYIPAATLSAGESGYVTSLTKAEVRALK